MQPYLLPHKRAYLIAGIAGILGFFALLLPFVVVTLFAVPLSFSAFQLASINGGAGVVGLVLLLILATITLAALG